jgi:peptide/nickel transport system ATP-binding protein
MKEILQTSALELTFQSLDGPVNVLRGVNIVVREHERVALVGESGSGKSVTARAIMGLLPERRTRISGSIVLDGRNLLKESASRMRDLRGRDMTMIFQDPTAALNPVYTIRNQFSAVVSKSSPGISATEAEERMSEALEAVFIADPIRVLDSYSFQLSGGLNQRVMIAMSLVSRPKLLIADEPGTALDVTVQQQTLHIMKELSDSYGTSILFISHNLGVVRHFADRVYVMYSGKIVEEAPTRELFANPRHPYTRALLESVPRLVTSVLPAPIEGSVPDPREQLEGCPFEPRCAFATHACTRPVSFREVGLSHSVACVQQEEFA